MLAGLQLSVPEEFLKFCHLVPARTFFGAAGF